MLLRSSLMAADTRNPKYRRSAATTRLEPGEHSIDRNTVVTRTIAGQKREVLDWNVRLWDTRLIAKRTQGSSKGEVKRRAKRTADALLESSGGPTTWKPTHLIETFIEEVSRPKIASSDLSDLTKKRYNEVLAHITTQLKGRSITGVMHMDVIVPMIEAIGHGHGPVNAKHAKTVMGKYVIQEARLRRIISQDPMVGVSVNFEQFANISDGPKRGGEALTPDEQERVTRHLLERDPRYGVEPDKKHGYHYWTRVNRNRVIIALTLFQIGTGVRISEGLAVTREHLEYSEDQPGLLQVHLTEDIVKGKKKPRTTPIFDPRIQTFIEDHVEGLRPDQLLFPTPSKPEKIWPASGSTGASASVEALYEELAVTLNVPTMKHNRSHLWRTTLSARLREAGVDRVDYAAMLGHDAKINEKHYTAAVDLSGVTQVYRSLHGPSEAT